MAKKTSQSTKQKSEERGVISNVQVVDIVQDPMQGHIAHVEATITLEPTCHVTQCKGQIKHNGHSHNNGAGPVTMKLKPGTTNVYKTESLIPILDGVTGQSVTGEVSVWWACTSDGNEGPEEGTASNLP